MAKTSNKGSSTSKHLDQAFLSPVRIKHSKKGDFVLMNEKHFLDLKHEIFCLQQSVKEMSEALANQVNPRSKKTQKKSKT